MSAGTTASGGSLPWARSGAVAWAVVYTWRQGVRRIISARKANKGETDVYQKGIAPEDREK